MTSGCQSTLTKVEVTGKSLEVLLCELPFAQHTIVLLHEALGSVSYWKDFPDKLAASTGCRVLAYSRAGHGNSQGPVEPRSPEYYRNQVEVVLPALLHHFAVQEPILYGHSEGAAIAMLYAAEPSKNVSALIAEAPVVAPEARTRERIQELAATYLASELSRKLGRYHSDPDALFQSWIASVDSPLLHKLPLGEYLPKIQCPMLVLQGSEDEFGGAIQLLTIQKYLPHAQCELIPGAGHLLHREQTDVVIEKVRNFLGSHSLRSKEQFVVSHQRRT